MFSHLRRTATGVFGVLVYLSAPCPALAKCETAHYVLEGRVTSAATHMPVEGATLTVLADGAMPRPDNNRPIPNVTGESGAFSVGFYFNTLESYCLLFGHNCSRRPDAIAIAISAPGYRSRMAMVRQSEIPSGAADIRLFVPEQETTLAPEQL